ncbi:TRAF-interacting protein [Trichinella pseudospiralis]|uniref:TRAF-interacting protein n=2 Tax=Trichinella pseudospiralis TaxID=6337 RepID=A0A0V1EJN5_TRIPS|nr:TRAF-interacting protein [Trichinella pseudospiralis]KRY89043.1 TRAF-interacting protein [Trichinella pseudospiralis]KRZ21295.1 TRAF-interacting protein [Trichinella pseudospiralis]KRZ37646.1 TRAF-interacting protein [Trichinella pseudospiralis]KRZ37647.1 TRAF-interacting protein [Trichinella pseudospiralis]
MPYNCSICLQHLDPNQSSALYCGHTFHAQCVQEWLSTSKFCPICRSTVRKNALIKSLYFGDGYSANELSDEQLQGLVSSLNDRIEKLEKENKALKASCTVSKNEVTKKSQQLDTTTKKLEELEKSMAVLKVAYASHQVMEAQIAKLTLELESYKKKLSFYRRVQKLLDSKDSDLLDEDLDDLTDPQEIMSCLLVMKQKFKNCQRSNLDLTKTIKELKTKMSKYKKAVVALREELKIDREDPTKTPYNPSLKPLMQHSGADISDVAGRCNFSDDDDEDFEICRRTRNSHFVICKNKDVVVKKPLQYKGTNQIPIESSDESDNDNSFQISGGVNMKLLSGVDRRLRKRAFSQLNDASNRKSSKRRALQ